MVLGFAERYSFEKKHEDRVVLLMRQRAHGLRVGALCAVVLLGTWWIGPYGPQTTSAPRMPPSFYWLWSGFFGFVCLLSVFPAPFYKKDHRGHQGHRESVPVLPLAWPTATSPVAESSR